MASRMRQSRILIRRRRIFTTDILLQLTSITVQVIPVVHCECIELLASGSLQEVETAFTVFPLGR